VRLIKLDAPESAFKDIRGNHTLNGLAVECLDASSAPLTDPQGFPLLVLLHGEEGTYTLPEGTKKVLLWVDVKVYGDWWSRFSTQAVDATAQETIVLSVVERPSGGPGKSLPDRRRKTPSSPTSG
jgi:hypothetical protein